MKILAIIRFSVRLFSAFIMALISLFSPLVLRSYYSDSVYTFYSFFSMQYYVISWEFLEKTNSQTPPQTKSVGVSEGEVCTRSLFKAPPGRSAWAEELLQ